MLTSLLRTVLFAGVISVPVHSHADDVMSTMDTISVEVLEKSTAMWNGEKLPPYSAGQPEISIVKVTIPEGASLPLHEHPFATAGVLLQGHIEVRTPGGDRQELKAGEGLIELINRPHAGANIGSEPAVILVVYAGIEGRAVTHLVDSDTDAEEPL